MNKISEKIFFDARQSVQEIERHSQEEIKILSEKFLRIEEAERGKIELELEGLSQQYLQKIISLSRIESRKRILLAKHQILDRLFAELAAIIENDPRIYLSFLCAMAFKGSLSGSERIIVSEKDRKLISESFLKTVNDRLYYDKGIDGMLVRSDDTRDITGLFLEKDRICFNATVNLALARIRSDFEVEIVKIIFPPDEEKAHV